MRVAAVIEKDTAASDAVFGPVVDGAFVVCGGAGDVCSFCLQSVSIEKLGYES
jgi:hypothetical protein